MGPYLIVVKQPALYDLRLGTESTESHSWHCAVPLRVRPEPSSPKWDCRSPIVADNLHSLTTYSRQS